MAINMKSLFARAKELSANAPTTEYRKYAVSSGITATARLTDYDGAIVSFQAKDVSPSQNGNTSVLQDAESVVIAQRVRSDGIKDGTKTTYRRAEQEKFSVGGKAAELLKHETAQSFGILLPSIRPEVPAPAPAPEKPKKQRKPRGRKSVPQNIESRIEGTLPENNGAAATVS